MIGREPVYRTASGVIIKDSRGANASQADAAIQPSNNGYRLPTSNEWAMAARWKDDTTSTDGSIFAGGGYWIPGNFTSGAIADYNNEAATRAVVWYTRTFTRPVGQLLPNHLGFYDMSGNAWEWTYTTSGSGRIVRGGSYSNGYAVDIQVGRFIELSSRMRMAANEGHALEIVIGGVAISTCVYPSNPFKKPIGCLWALVS
jgi:formylglycine-generating enzyme required for sulfatase activity